MTFQYAAPMERVDLFATPVWIDRDGLPPAQVAAVRAHILALHETEPGVHRSNAGGGWHSEPDLFRRIGLADIGEVIAAHARATFRAIAARAGQDAPPLTGVQLQAWAMVLPAGGYAEPHDHADAHLSGVLHLDAADDEGGRLVLLDPRGSHLPWAPLDPTTFHVAPRPGQLIWFPAGLRHWVTPVQRGPRVSIAVNVRYLF